MSVSLDPGGRALQPPRAGTPHISWTGGQSSRKNNSRGKDKGGNMGAAGAAGDGSGSGQGGKGGKGGTSDSVAAALSALQAMGIPLNQQDQQLGSGSGAGGAGAGGAGAAGVGGRKGSIGSDGKGSGAGGDGSRPGSRLSGGPDDGTDGTELDGQGEDGSGAGDGSQGQGQKGSGSLTGTGVKLGPKKHSRTPSQRLRPAGRRPSQDVLNMGEDPRRRGSVDGYASAADSEGSDAASNAGEGPEGRQRKLSLSGGSVAKHQVGPALACLPAFCLPCLS